MGVGEIAGLIAAIAFAILAGFMIYPLIRLGKLFDQLAETVKETGDHAIPALDESVTTVQQVNKSLEDVNKISAAASTTANNVSALTDLYGSFLGKPVIKVASAAYALKTTAQSFMNKKNVNSNNKGSDVQASLLDLHWCGHRRGGSDQSTGVRQGQHPDAARQFLFGPDQDHVAVRTLEGLFNEFNETRRAREAELNTKYADKIS